MSYLLVTANVEHDDIDKSPSVHQEPKSKPLAKGDSIESSHNHGRNNLPYASKHEHKYKQCNCGGAFNRGDIGAEAANGEKERQEQSSDKILQLVYQGRS